MKRRIMALLLSGLLALSAGVVWANAAVTRWTYDNSFLVTLERPHGQALEVLLPEIFGETTVIQKTAGESVDTYQMVVTDAGGGDWNDLKQVLLAGQGVVSVERNPYADDYGEKNSFITLNKAELTLAVGATDTLQVEDYQLCGNDGYEVIGVEFTLSPDACDTIEEGGFSDFRIGTFWGVPADAEKTDGTHTKYTNYHIDSILDDWFGDERKNTRSETNTYFGIPTFMEEDWKSGNSVSGVRSVLDALGCDPRVTAVQPIYRDPYPTGLRPYEWWWMGNTSVAQITTMTNTEELPDWTEEPSADPTDHEECFFHRHTVTVKGVKEGSTVLQVVVADDGIEHIVDLTINVVAAPAGDVDGNGKTEAADALMILKQVVGKITLTQAQMTAADLNGDGEVGAADALCVLRIVVGKPAV